MKIQKIAKILIIMVALGTNIGCDQISKSIVRQKINFNERISFVNDHFTLIKVENPGAFLSVGHTLPQPFRTLVLIILPLLVLALAIIYLLTTKGLSTSTIVGICFVVGGGIGNIYDRMMYGSVTDFLHIDFGLFETGVFNMADVSIMTGMFVILLETYCKRSKWIRKTAGTTGIK